MKCSRCGMEITKRNNEGISRFEMNQEVFDDIRGYHYKWNKEKHYLCKECTGHFTRIFMNKANFNASRTMMNIEYGDSID